tara:strand:- start:30637 stop:31935 length:1299 start_codon:yes stop_codon:yes gene_type:complete
MTSIPLILPPLGDDASTSGEIISISDLGATIQVGEIYMEVETDKVVVEVPAEIAGVITHLSVAIGDTVTGGEKIGEIVPDSDAAVAEVESTAVFSGEAEIQETNRTENISSYNDRSSDDQPSATTHQTASPLSRTPAGPTARRLARELDVKIEEIAGTGARSRVTKQDVIQHARAKIMATGEASNAHRALSRQLPDISQFGKVSTRKLSGIGKATARNMQFAWSEIPHAWVQSEIDITELEILRKQIKAQSSAPMPLTITAIVCKVVATALHRFPNFNAVFDQGKEELILRDYINLGVAVDTPRGLMVPGIRNVNDMSAIQIAYELKDISDRAIASKLSEKDLQGNGFTISNLGGLGVSGMFPVVNWPEVAILGVSSGRELCALREGQVTTRLVMPVTLGFDHRVINGADAARFLGFIKRTIEQPMTLLIET